MEISHLKQELKEYYDRELADSETIIDVEIKPWINQINQYPFIRTTQCCGGHPDNGYLSVILAQNYIHWFETEVVAALAYRGFDVVKRFERIKNKVIGRHVFWFNQDTREQFFQFFLARLKEKAERERGSPSAYHSQAKH